MTGHEQNKTGLNEEKEAFDKARKERQAAREKLRDSEQELERVRHALKELRTQKRLLENTRDKTAKASEKLVARIEKAEAGLARDRAQQKSADTAEQALQELQTRQRQLQAEQARNDEELENLTAKIQEKQREERDKEAEGDDNRGHLTSAKQEVIETAADLNGAAAAVPFDQIKSFVWESLKELKVSGATGIGYLYSVFLGAIFDFSFYRDSGIDIFRYYQAEDFLFSSHKVIIIPVLLLALLWLIQGSFSLFLGKLARIKLPSITEFFASRCSGIIYCLPIKPTFVLIVLAASFVLAAEAGIFYHTYQQSHGKNVFVTTQQSSKQSQEFMWVGANSTYMFFRGPEDGEDGNDTGITVIPRAEILSISQTVPPTPPESPARVILDREDNFWIEELVSGLSLEDHVTERNARVDILKKMICGNGGRPDMSEFILFKRKSKKLEGMAEEQIAKFMKRPGRMNRMRIFGFTSPDGDGGHNGNLSGGRAEAVKKEVESKYKDYLPAGTHNVLTDPIGENHSINGIANSRSAVIAACRSEPDKAEEFQ